MEQGGTDLEARVSTVELELKRREFFLPRALLTLWNDWDKGTEERRAAMMGVVGSAFLFFRRSGVVIVLGSLLGVGLASWQAWLFLRQNQIMEAQNRLLEQQLTLSTQQAVTQLLESAELSPSDKSAIAFTQLATLGPAGWETALSIGHLPQVFAGLASGVDRHSAQQVLVLFKLGLRGSQNPSREIYTKYEVREYLAMLLELQDEFSHYVHLVRMRAGKDERFRLDLRDALLKDSDLRFAIRQTLENRIRATVAFKGRLPWEGEPREGRKLLSVLVGTQLGVTRGDSALLQKLFLDAPLGDCYADAFVLAVATEVLRKPETKDKIEEDVEGFLTCCWPAKQADATAKPSPCPLHKPTP